MSRYLSRITGAGYSFMLPVFLGGLAVLTQQGHAGTVLIIGSPGDSTEGLGDFEGSIDYTPDGPLSTTGTLVVTLTNTTDPGNGGFITGFLFDAATVDPNFSATLLGSPAPTHPFETCTGTGLNGEPFGNPYDGGAALGGEFLGGGSPNAGIAIGDTGTFHLGISATDAALLESEDFLIGGDYEFNFIVRFRGLTVGEGSDKVPAVIIPLPAPIALGSLGLLGVVLGSRRLRRKLEA